MNAPPKVIIIDFDGTIVDSNEIWKNAYKSFVLNNGYTFHKYLYDNHGLISFDDWERQIIMVYETEKTPESILKEIKENAIILLSRIPPRKSFKKYINQNTKSSIIVISKEEKNIIQPYLKRFYLSDIRQDIHNYRNEVKLYEDMAKEFECQTNEITLIDDSLSHCIASKNAGCITIGINDNHSKERQKQMISVCDMYVHDFTPLLTF